MMSRQGSVIAGVVWMFIVSVLLFWLPVFGSLIAGIVGGKKAGGVGPAALAVFVPALVLAVFSFVFTTTVTGLPLVGAVAGAGGFVFAAVGVGPLLVGAIIGGALA
ncbi:MAG: hypothetical protein JW993_04355 [Sedimentisphaerales bacterium]|nr:hypothetical protein [Sedimentisphaerales bacterium]